MVFIQNRLTTSDFNLQVKNNNIIVKNLIRDLIRANRNQIQVIQKRHDVADNEIDIDYTTDLKPPPFQNLEIDETDDSESGDSDSGDSDEDNGAEESVEKQSNKNGGSKQDSASNSNNGDDDDNDSDYDDVPGGDGQGGGILGLLAGLSGVSVEQK